MSFYKVIFSQHYVSEIYPCLYMQHFHCSLRSHLLIHCPVDGYVDNFQFFQYKQYYKHFTYVSPCAYVRTSLEVHCRVEGQAHLTLIKHCKIALQSDCTNLFSHQHPLRVSVYLLYSIVNTQQCPFLIIANATGVKWYLI